MCQITTSTQYLKLLSEISRYDLYYSLTPSSSLLGLKLVQAHTTLYLIFIK